MAGENREDELVETARMEQALLPADERACGRPPGQGQTASRDRVGGLGRLERRLLGPRLQTQDDRELVAQAAAGDHAAFGELYRRHADAVYTYVVMRIHDTASAEDVCQDVFLCAYKALPRFRWQGRLRPWLLQIAHNRLVNFWRSVGRHPEEVAGDRQDEGEDGLDEPPDPTDDFAAVECRLDVETILPALATLTELQREVLALRFGSDLSVAETAAVMSRSVTAVTNLQFHALANLRRRLAARDGVQR
jgi:RNA polymerase sigma-70 factor (ECF subfamily)